MLAWLGLTLAGWWWASTHRTLMSVCGISFSDSRHKFKVYIRKNLDIWRWDLTALKSYVERIMPGMLFLTHVLTYLLSASLELFETTTHLPSQHTAVTTFAFWMLSVATMLSGRRRRPFLSPITAWDVYDTTLRSPAESHAGRYRKKPTRYRSGSVTPQWLE